MNGGESFSSQAEGERLFILGCDELHYGLVGQVYLHGVLRTVAFVKLGCLQRLYKVPEESLGLPASLFKLGTHGFSMPVQDIDSLVIPLCMLDFEINE